MSFDLIKSYMNYSTEKAVMQGATPLNYARTHYSNCSPHSRCKSIHKCETCHNIHATKQLNKHFNTIQDEHLKKFKFVKYITITPKDLVKDFEIHNSNIDIYNNYLTNSSKRKSKKHPFYNCEYISFKEITKSEGNKNAFPHLHIILLTNTNPLFDNQLFDYDIRDIQINLDDTYKEYNDYNNPLTQTLKNIFAYSTKPDKYRLSYERIFDTSKGKNDIRVSRFFKIKHIKTNKIIPIHIQHIKNIRKQCRAGRRKALLAHSLYKQQKGNSNTLAVHKHALKTKRKLIKLENQKKVLISRVISKLKRFSVRPVRKKVRTHQKNTP